MTTTAARERFEKLYAEYVSDGTYCIGRDAWWPMDLDRAYREACGEACGEQTAANGGPGTVTDACGICSRRFEFDPQQVQQVYNEAADMWLPMCIRCEDEALEARDNAAVQDVSGAAPRL
jgi:hypothetical protein